MYILCKSYYNQNNATFIKQYNTIVVSYEYKIEMALIEKEGETLKLKMTRIRKNVGKLCVRFYGPYLRTQGEPFLPEMNIIM